MSPDRDQAIPFALSTNDQEDGQRPPGKSRKKHCIICCSFCALLTITVIAVVLIVLALTVFKVKEPRLTMNTITIEQLSVGTGSSLTVPIAINMTILAGMSVSNPNSISMRFGDSTTMLYYDDRLIGEAFGPPGKAKAHKVFAINVTVDVLGDQVIGSSKLIGDLASDELGLRTSTKVGGRVIVFGIFKHHVDVVMNCTLTVAVSNTTIMDQDCGQKVKL